MSTRATYQFTDITSGETRTFYIHYDGYLEGAAEYFQEALDIGGDLMQAFEDLKFSEYCGTHHAHNDTEYRYEVEYDDKELLELTVYHRDTDWKVVFQGTLTRFLNEHLQPELTPAGNVRQLADKLAKMDRQHPDILLLESAVDMLRILAIKLEN